MVEERGRGGGVESLVFEGTEVVVGARVVGVVGPRGAPPRVIRVDRVFDGVGRDVSVDGRLLGLADAMDAIDALRLDGGVGRTGARG